MRQLKSFVIALAVLGLALAAPFPVLCQAEGAPAPQPFSVSASAAVLVDASTGTVLYDKAMHQRRAMASTTKIMTALVTLESADLKDLVPIGDDAMKVESPGLDFNSGERLTLDGLLTALMLKSSNAAAIAIADYVAGSVPGFARKMNERAQTLGLKDTHFVNPHGLSAPEHYSSAYDLAAITRAAMGFGRFRALVAEKMAEISRPDMNATETVTNHNKLLWRADYVDGVKTGWVRDSGHCLVASGTRNGWQLIAVVLDSGDTYSDALALLDYGFATYHQQVFAQRGDSVGRTRVRFGSPGSVSAIAQQLLAQVTGPGLPPAGKLEVTTKRLTAPIARGTVVGAARVMVGGRPLATSQLVAGDPVKRSPLVVAGEWAARVLGLLAIAAVGIRTGAKLVKIRRRRRSGVAPQSSGPCPSGPRQG
jgi:D-alanyl-D-alanine carboxypeptidase (penicillin-binding protein 5/6)